MESVNYEDSIQRIDGRVIPAVGRWELDIHNTFAGFVAPHLVLARVRGRIPKLDAWMEVAEKPEESRLEVILDATSLTTDHEARDEHLRGPDFLHVDKYPNITFTSTTVEPIDDNWRVTGDLTIRGITNSVDLDVRFLGTTIDWGNVKSLFYAETTIDRYKWGMTWSRALDWGGVAVGREAVLEIHAQMKLITEMADRGDAPDGGPPGH